MMFKKLYIGIGYEYISSDTWSHRGGKEDPKLLHEYWYFQEHEIFHWQNKK